MPLRGYTGYGSLGKIEIYLKMRQPVDLQAASFYNRGDWQEEQADPMHPEVLRFKEGMNETKRRKDA